MLRPELALAAEIVEAHTLRFDAGVNEHGARDVPIEAPIAFEYDGVGYAVMMASPSNLHGYAVGFRLSERLVASVDDIKDVEPAQVKRGWVMRIRLRGDASRRLHERIRLRLTEGSCGLCGLETIELVLRPLPKVPAGTAVDRSAVARALATIGGQQPLGRSTGDAHAAAFCAADGTILLVREDVGRHNAIMDKLVGANAKIGLDLAKGFVLLTARCSYELVEKAATAGCPTLVTISAPTSLAVERARECDLTLVALARRDSVLVLNDPHKTFGE